MIGATAKCSHYPIRTTARQPRRVLDSTGVIRSTKYHQIRSKIAARMDDTHTNCTRGIRRHPLTKPIWHYLPKQMWTGILQYAERHRACDHTRAVSQGELDTGEQDR